MSRVVFWFGLFLLVRSCTGMPFTVPPQGYEKNIGQYAADVLYANDDTLFYQDKVQIVSGLMLQFVNASPNCVVTVQNPLPYPLNVYAGAPQSWRVNVTQYGTVAFSQLYPGIDVQWSVAPVRSVQIVIAPGSDPRQLLMRLNQEALVGQGSVTGFNGQFYYDEFFFSLKAYQRTRNADATIAVQFVAFDADSFQVSPGPYDKSLPLVIEIRQVYFNALYGSSLHVTRDGSVVLAGFPSFLAKLNPDGIPVFLTRLGGVQPFWIGTAAAASITVAGLVAVFPGEPNPPITPDAPQATSSTGWLGSFDGAGKLHASTYTDTTLYGADYPPLSLTSDGSVYFTTTRSVIKWQPGNREYLFSASIPRVGRLATNELGELAFSSILQSGQPTTSGAVDNQYDGPWDIYIGKLDPVSGALRMATYVPVVNPSPDVVAARFEIEVFHRLGLAPDGTVWIGSQIILPNGVDHTLVGVKSNGNAIVHEDALTFLPTIAFDSDGGLLILAPVTNPNLSTSPDAPLRAACASSLYFSKRAADGSVVFSTYLPLGQSIVQVYGSNQIYVMGPDGLERVDTTLPSTPGIACLIDVASRQPMNLQAAGELVTIVGQQLGPLQEARAALDAQGNLPLQLAGVQVLVSGNPVPILSVQRGLITFYLPPNIPANPQAALEVATLENIQINSSMDVATVPRFEVLTADGSGSGYAAALNQDGTINSPANAAPSGTIVSIFGVGNTVPASVMIDSVNALIEYAGPAPTLPPGVQQINMLVPKSNSGVGFTQLIAAVPGASPQPPNVFLSVAQ